VAVLTAAAAVVATGAFGPTTPPAAAGGLRPFDGCAQLRDWYVDALRPMVGPYGLANGWGADAMTLQSSGGAERATASGPPMADTAASSAVDSAVGSGATGTNLQEVGVDEPDVMKTADGLLYTTVGDRLVVLDVSGDRPRELGSLTVPALAAAYRGWGDGGHDGPAGGAEPGTAELLLAGDRLVLLSHGWYQLSDPGTSAGQGTTTWTGPAGSPTTTTTVVDVSDPSSPRQVSQQEVEGSVVGARLSDGVARVVTTSTPAFSPATVPPPPVLPGDRIDPTWESEATEANLLALERMSGEDFLPHNVVRDGDGTVLERTPALSCGDVTHPGAAAGAGMLTVRSLDLQADDPVVDATAVAADGEMLYASADRLYVATTRGGWSRWTMPADVPAPDEPATDQPVTTELHGFRTDRGAGTSYLASGEVDGFLLGRWAMSARDGRLRVATTTGSTWGGDAQQQSESLVTVLAERGEELVQEGQVGGLGLGETVRAVRWFDDVAVVVTFRQTDPLYAVDLSDPAAPTVTGELKVPGYSAYLHPVGDGRLIGVGQYATAQGRTTGVLVQTFDVSDPAAPTQVDTWTEADTWTSVEGDSRQFSYLPNHRTALMPMDTMGRPAVLAFSVSDDGTLTEAGRHDLDGQGYRWLVRAMPVGDAVAVLTGGEQGAAVTLLDVDGLAETGTTALD